MEVQKKYQERIYKYSEVCIFRKTKEVFGGLSNMAPGYPVKINGKHILTSEALYQACRFPHLPDIQQRIIAEKSPMTAKMVSKPFLNTSRPDWDNVRTDIMYWCLRVKLAQNFIPFGQLLETTFDRPIVEDSNKDAFWGAIQDKKNTSELRGVNALGRLLMKLRQEYNSPNRFNLLFVEPLSVPNFLMFGEQIQAVDERQSFINNLNKNWKIASLNMLTITFDKSIPINGKVYLNGNSTSQISSIVAEPEEAIENSKVVKPKEKKKKAKANQPELALSQSLI